jgi:hypothetical protein
MVLSFRKMAVTGVVFAAAENWTRQALGYGSEGCPMPAYLVRIIDTRDIVGFFHADEMDELLIAINACTMRPIASTSEGAATGPAPSRDD